MKMISMVSSADLFLRRWRKTMRWTDLTSVNSLQRRPRFSRTKIFSNKISKPKKHRSLAGEVEQGRGGGGRVDEEVDPVGVRAGQDQGGAGLVLQLRFSRRKKLIFVFVKVMTTQKLEDKEKALLAAELEVSTLNR